MLKHCLIVFGVSMVPLIELRGAIPYGVAFGLPLWQTYCIAIVGNMLPVPIIYFFARKVPAGRRYFYGRDVKTGDKSADFSPPAGGQGCETFRLGADIYFL